MGIEEATWRLVAGRRRGGRLAALRHVLVTAVLLAWACGPPAPESAPGSAPASAPESAPASPSAAAPVVAPDALFERRSADVGVDFVHFNGMTGRLYLAEIMCAGGALLDVDEDGDLDLYLPQGALLGADRRLEDALVAPRHPAPLTDRLYRNDLDDGGRLAFSDITSGAGLDGTTGYGCTAAVGDVDGDGHLDLYLGNVGPNQLLRGLGDGRFEDITARSPAALADPRSSVAATFFDYDRDGRLDLYVANYVDYQLADPPPCFDRTGAPDYCGPGAFPFEGDRLLRGLGGGRFEDVTARAGLAGMALPALGVVAADFTADGWPDLYVANDGQPNQLWVNQGDGTFRDDALLAGCALNGRGDAEASMGIDAADFDADGDLDIFLAHLMQESNTLYVNDGSGMFEDATQRSGLAAVSLPFTAFGAGWLDYDNDGWLDLAVVNGAVVNIAELVRRGDPFPLHQPNQLLRGLGDGRFEDVTAAAGEAFALSRVSRAAAFGDLDNDGDTDLVVSNVNGPVDVLINRVGSARPWLGLRLLSGEPARDALGARVGLHRAGRPTQWRWVTTGGSYNAAHDPRLLFGLGDDPRVTGLTIHWPDGTVEARQPPPLGRYTTLRQGG